MGIKNSVISNREMYRSFYTDKLDKILLRENGKIDYWLYKTKTEYFVHMKIPSEAIDKFYYDVVIKFTPQKGKVSTPVKILDDYDVSFFSNDPSFVFTFAHSFIKNGMFFTDLKSKMSKEAIKEVAKERNPKNEVGYVKSLYFAYLIMKQKGLFKKLLYVNAAVYDKDRLEKVVTHADIKIHDRQEQAKRISAEARRKNKSDTRSDHIISDDNDDSSFKIKTTKRISNTKTTSSVIGSKRSNIAKITKKTKRR